MPAFQWEFGGRMPVKPEGTAFKAIYIVARTAILCVAIFNELSFVEIIVTRQASVEGQGVKHAAFMAFFTIDSFVFSAQRKIGSIVIKLSQIG